MGIGNLTKTKARRIIGIDASTKSLAFAVFEDDKPIDCGEIFFDGATVFERLYDAKNKTAELVANGTLQADYVCIESAVMVKSIQVVIDMSYVFGVILGELMVNNPEVHKVAPISWQTGIGNPNLKPAEKLQLRQDNPGQKDSWYQKKGREIRKARTMVIARNYFPIESNSDNISDAVGLALYVSQSLTRR